MTESETERSPALIYGTAWKAEATAELVRQAVLCGFTAIDSAAQLKHYREDLVGVALQRLLSEGISRQSLFLQSKFTFVGGHDHRVPYDPKSDYGTQVHASFARTLENLRTSYLDSYLLHGPSSRRGLQSADWEVWQAMEELCQRGLTRRIGVSNVGLDQLSSLLAKCKIRPKVVQNRCYARYGWDHGVREFCEGEGILYQGFSLLTANPYVTRAPAVLAIADRRRVTPAQVALRFAQQIAIVPLTGTKNRAHMLEDLAIGEFELSADELAAIAALEPE